MRIKEAEHRWIAQARAEGHPLTNSQVAKARRGDEERIMHEARERDLQPMCGTIYSISVECWYGRGRILEDKRGTLAGDQDVQGTHAAQVGAT